MFSFFKRKKPGGLKLGQIIKNDFHAHLIPGIDDGPKNMESALQLVAGMKSLGFDSITATPHVFSDYYPNTTKKILEAYGDLKENVERAGIDISLKVAAEYYLDDTFVKLLKNEAPLTIYKNYVLVETSLLSADPNFYSYIFTLQTKGFIPIIAHPERYVYMFEADYQTLRDRGCLFQINLLSLVGYYGKKVYKKTDLLIKKGFIDFIATDVHHMGHMKAIESGLINRKYQALLVKLDLQNDQLFL